MRKFLLVVVLLLMLALPVAASDPIKIFVNGKYVGDGVVIENQVYVPVRFVAEELNANVGWDGSVQIKPVIIPSRPVIHDFVLTDIDTSGFKQKLTEALDLLQEKDVGHYNMVCQNITSIYIEELNTEMIEKAYAIAGGTSVGITPTLINDKKRYTPIFLAGVLVHEAVHAAGFRVYGVDRFDKGISLNKEEYTAYTHEATTLELINAPQWMLQDQKITREKYRS